MDEEVGMIMAKSQSVRIFTCTRDQGRRPGECEGMRPGVGEG